MSNIRIRQCREAFTIVENRIMRDASLSSDARFLYALLVGYADGWEISYDRLRQVTGWGRDKLRKAVGELKDRGLLRIEATRVDDGTFRGWEWHVGLENRTSENPTFGETELRQTRPSLKEPYNEEPLYEEPYPPPYIPPPQAGGGAKRGVEALLDSRQSDESGKGECAEKRERAGLSGHAGNGRSRRGSRIPDDWHLGDAEWREAERIGLTRRQAELEAEMFIDYWRAAPGQRGVKLDWMATWRNWCRKAMQRRRPVDEPRRIDVRATLDKIMAEREAMEASDGCQAGRGA